MRSDPSELSTYVLAGRVSTEDEAFELERDFYCHGIPVRTVVDSLSGDIQILTFAKYHPVVSQVIIDYKNEDYVLESKALEKLIHLKTGFSPAMASKLNRREKMRRGVFIRIIMITIIIFTLMILFKHV